MQFLDSRPQLDEAFITASALYRDALENVTPIWSQLATRVSSNSESQAYPFKGIASSMREWFGDRVVEQLRAYDYRLVNRKFEKTIGVCIDQIADDQWGVLSTSFADMGYAVGIHADETVFEAINASRTALCYDGTPFFGTSHPIPDSATVQSNLDTGGSGDFWILANLRRPLKPWIYQVREEAQFVSLTDLTDENMFWRDEAIFGAKKRCAAGHAFWQMAYASNQDLTEENLWAVKEAMKDLISDEEHKLRMVPTHLIVGTGREREARIALAGTNSAGGFNPGAALGLEVIESPFFELA